MYQFSILCGDTGKNLNHSKTHIVFIERNFKINAANFHLLALHELLKPYAMQHFGQIDFYFNKTRLKLMLQNPQLLSAKSYFQDMKKMDFLKNIQTFEQLEKFFCETRAALLYDTVSTCNIELYLSIESWSYSKKWLYLICCSII